MSAADSSSHLRSGLLDRREKLAATIELVPNNRNLQQLLEEVDAALDRLKAGRYGICEICNEQIEGNQLQVDPLRRHCPSHLAPMEQAGDSRELSEATRAVMNIQRRLLPNSEIPLGPWEFCFDYAPVGPVGGDYCDLVCGYDRGDHGNLVLPRDHFLFVGDVMGKGFAASKISSQLNGVVRTLLNLNYQCTRCWSVLTVSSVSAWRSSATTQRSFVFRSPQQGQLNWSMRATCRPFCCAREERNV